MHRSVLKRINQMNSTASQRTEEQSLDWSLYFIVFTIKTETSGSVTLLWPSAELQVKGPLRASESRISALRHTNTHLQKSEHKTC